MIYRIKTINSIKIEYPMGGDTAINVYTELEHPRVAIAINPNGGLSIDLYHRLTADDARLMAYYLTTCANILESDQNGWSIKPNSFNEEDVGQQIVDGPNNKSSCQYTFSVNARTKKAHMWLHIMDPIYLSMHVDLNRHQAHELSQALIRATYELSCENEIKDRQAPATVT